MFLCPSHRLALAWVDVHQSAHWITDLNFISSFNLETPGSDRLIETILALYDIETAKNMLELSLEREDISISGYTANREAHRGCRAEITTLVNGRWIRDSNLAYAVEQAYDKTLPPHRHPISVINIEIPGHLVDINAHPTKQEVRFKNSNKVFGAVRQAVEQALLEHSPIHRIQPTLSSQVQTSPRFSPLEAGNPARLEPGPRLSPETPPTADGPSIGISGYSRRTAIARSPLNCDLGIATYPMMNFSTTMISIDKKHSLSMPTVLACGANSV